MPTKDPEKRKAQQLAHRRKQQAEFNAAHRALREAYGKRVPARRKPPVKRATLEEMLADNPTALMLLERARAISDERAAREAARTREIIESWERLGEAQAAKTARPAAKAR